MTDPIAYAAAMSEKLPAPRPSVSRTKVGTPTIHVPDEIVRIDAVPRTLSGKKLEVPVKKILMGADPEKAASRDSLANPDAFDWFVSYARSGPIDSSSRSSSAPQKA